MKRKFDEIFAILQSDKMLKLASWACGAAIVVSEMAPEGSVKRGAEIAVKICAALGVYSTTGRTKK